MGRARAPRPSLPPLRPSAAGRAPRPARARTPLHRRARANPAAARRWLVAATATAVTLVALVQVVGAARAERAAWGRRVPVLVAGRDVRTGERLRSAVRVERWPSALVPGAVVARLDADDRAATAIDADAPITRSAVVGHGRHEASTSGRRRVALVLTGPRLPVARGEVVDVWASTDAGAGTDAGVATRRVARSAVVVRAGEQRVVVAVAPSEEPAVANAAATSTVTLTAPA